MKLSDESPVRSGKLNMKSRVDLSHFTCQNKESLGSNTEDACTASLRNTPNFDTSHKPQMPVWKAHPFKQCECLTDYGKNRHFSPLIFTLYFNFIGLFCVGGVFKQG